MSLSDDFGKSTREKVGLMGGYNSGRWHSYTPRQTTEGAYGLAIEKLIKALSDRGGLAYASQSLASITYSWYRGENQTGSIGLSFHNPGGRSPYFLLTYAVSDVKLAERVYLTSTGQHFGGRRWWFTCPYCGQRCGRVYLAAPRYKPACRLCHNLTYTSAQEAHQYESGSIGGLVRALNLATRAELIQKKMAKCRRWSKRYERLLDRYLKLYPALARLTRQIRATDEATL